MLLPTLAKTGKSLSDCLANSSSNMFCHKIQDVKRFSAQYMIGTKESPARVINLSSMAQWCFTTKDGISLSDLKASISYDPWQR